MSRVGLLLTHGTDTLAWTHAFIRYSIKNNHANIVLTGSIFSINRGRLGCVRAAEPPAHTPTPNY